jgi:hypothetical protein
MGQNAGKSSWVMGGVDMVREDGVAFILKAWQ